MMSPAAGKPVLYLSLIISPLVHENNLVGKEFDTYNVYHNRKEDWLSTILRVWLRLQQLHTGM